MNFFVQGKTAQQNGGPIHIGICENGKTFCGHHSRLEQTFETEISIVQPDEFESKSGCPAKIEIVFFGYRQVLFRDHFCKKCYDALVKINPSLKTELRFS